MLVRDKISFVGAANTTCGCRSCSWSLYHSPLCTSGELFLFLGYYVLGSLTKGLHSKQWWCRMILHHLVQFNQNHCNLRSHKVMSNYVSTSEFFSNVQFVFSFQFYILNSTRAKISLLWSFSGMSGPLAFSVFLFCHPLEDVIALKKQRFSKNTRVRI